MEPLSIRPSERPLDLTHEELDASACLPTPSSLPPDDPAPRGAGVEALIRTHQHKPPAPLGSPEKGPTDWCGSQGSAWVPEGGFGANWSDACKTHDECYARPGANKDLCDYNLEADMSLACASQGAGLLCHVTAGIYSDAVHLFGGPAFDRAQKGASDR